MEKQIERTFWYAVIFTFIIKIILSIAIPITSDEAYFVVWAQNLDFGYYDHPPMIGWFLYLLLFIGSSEFVVRLPAVLTTLFIGVGIYMTLKPYNRLKASLIATLFLVSPINILSVIVTTDTPLVLFSFSSVIFLYKALKSEKYIHYLFSGVFLGLAFLSKYFAVLLGISYFTYFIFSPKNKNKTLGFVLLFSSIIPFVMVNVFWNYTHGWANILFNLFNRNKKEEFSLLKFIIFAVSQLYLITPSIVYYLVKRRKEITERIKNTEFKIFNFAFLVPFAIFTLLSFKKVVGLHWLLAFYPIMYLIIFSFLNEEEIVKSIRFMVFFTLAHLFLIGTVLSIPIEYFKSNKNYGTIIMGARPKGVINSLKPFEDKYLFATPSYADSAVIAFHYGRYFMVFGGGSHHGRQDDIITDFSALQGKDILIVRQSEPLKEEYSSFFDTVDIKTTNVQGMVFYYVLGNAFNYQSYKEKVLTPIKDRYYNIPAFLPLSSSYFHNKYFELND